MKLVDKLKQFFRVPRLTIVRTCLALMVAVCADGLQMLTGFLGWEGPDQVIDLAAMLINSRLLGFHILFLPTFVVELLPVLDDLPTWTACTIAVIFIRRREQRALPPTTLPLPSPPVPVPTLKDGP
jgi:hypothetical protein